MKEIENWKEYRLSFTEEAEKIVHTLTLQEKIMLMSGRRSLQEVQEAIQKKSKYHYNEVPYQAGGNQEKGIPPILFVDGTRGVVCGRGKTTCFPVSSMRGATFDKKLEEQIGEAIAEEVLEAGGNLFGGVCVNLPYHPGWGRAQETYGEDSCLLGEMGAALVRGVQRNGVIACVKHFAFNSMENSRFEVNIICDKRTEREIFLPHFKKCIDAGAGAVMSAYNSYRGVLCGHHTYLLRQVLKGEWDFDGFTLCDFNWGMKDGVKAMESGLDIEMPNTCFYGQHLIDAVEKGVIREEIIQEAAIRIVRTLLAHDSVIRNRKEHLSGRELLEKNRKLALQCAREGITLLKNQNQILPLKIRKGGRIVVLGALAATENTGDRGSSQVYADGIVTLLQGITKISRDLEIIYYGGESISHCRKLAKDADAVIVVAGNDYRDEGEHLAANEGYQEITHWGGDRQKGLGLHEKEIKKIQAVTAFRKDVIVVLMGGSTITMTEWEKEAGAILLAYYPGVEGGTALGEILFGRCNPSGKLPFVIPKQEKDLPQIQWNTQEQWYTYEHGYTLLDSLCKKPLYPFGFGLSYTEFIIDIEKTWVENGAICVSVKLCNAGKRAGAEVLQMYVSVPYSKVKRPQKSLKAFERVYLEKGKEESVILSCLLKDLEYYHETDGYQLESTEYEIYVGNSSEQKNLQKSTIIVQ